MEDTFDTGLSLGRQFWTRMAHFIDGFHSESPTAAKRSVSLRGPPPRPAAQCHGASAAFAADLPWCWQAPGLTHPDLKVSVLFCFAVFFPLDPVILSGSQSRSLSACCINNCTRACFAPLFCWLNFIATSYDHFEFFT